MDVQLGESELGGASGDGALRKLHGHHGMENPRIRTIRSKSSAGIIIPPTWIVGTLRATHPAKIIRTKCVVQVRGLLFALSKATVPKIEQRSTLRTYSLHRSIRPFTEFEEKTIALQDVLEPLTGRLKNRPACVSN